MPRTFDQIVADMLNNLPAHINTGAGSMTRMLVEVVAAEIEKVERALVWNTPIVNVEPSWTATERETIKSVLGMDDRVAEQLEDAGDEAPADPPVKRDRKKEAYWSR